MLMQNGAAAAFAADTKYYVNGTKNGVMTFVGVSKSRCLFR